MQLPEGKIKSDTINPKRLLIYSKPKAGKTTLIAELDDCLLVDLEQGSSYVDAMKIKANNLKELRMLLKALIEAKKQGKTYKYIAIDTVTVLEDIAKEYALEMYKDSSMGKTFKDDDILKLANGAGYYWLRQAFFKMLDAFNPLTEHLILLGHLKDKRINDSGEMVEAANIDLQGKLRSLICSTADAIGYLYRKDNQTVISFKSNDEITCGARPEHLRNQEIVVAEITDEGYKTYWDKIFK